MPSGSKYWRMKYFFGGKEKLLALGVYPEVTLGDAREPEHKLEKFLRLRTTRRNKERSETVPSLACIEFL